LEAVTSSKTTAGWVVNRADSYTDLTIQDWMEKKYSVLSFQFSEKDKEEGLYGSRKNIFLERGGVAHRLDKDTSGLLILAKTPTVLIEMMRQFREREVSKTYVALVHGKLAPDTGIIRLPMSRSDHDYTKFTVDADGRLSETHYQVIQHFPGLPKGMSEKKGKSYQGFTYLQLMPKTGRTHQIRVHMAALKHPIVGDTTYAGRKRIVLDKEWCPRQFLHAKTLEFVHPVTKVMMQLEAPLAPDLQTTLTFLHD
jgi:23S rRNA pseudouridine1911/1915/1917 synthase